MNRSVAEYRAARATELAVQGCTYEEIAAELGYSDRSGAWRAVRRCLGRRQQVAADAFISTSLVDLEILHERSWDRALRGDPAAARTVLRAIEDRLRLVEYLSTQEDQRRTPDGHRTSRAVEAGEGDVGPFASLVF